MTLLLLLQNHVFISRTMRAVGMLPLYPFRESTATLVSLFLYRLGVLLAVTLFSCAGFAFGWGVWLHFSADEAMPTRATPSVQAVSQTTLPALEQRTSEIEAPISNRSLVGQVVARLGGNGWAMTITTLILFMTMPGLVLFYASLRERKPIFPVLARCMGIVILVTILWYLIGYSLVFSSGSPFLGIEFAMLGVVNSISHNAFSLYRLMFAIIAAILIFVAVVRHIKYSAFLVFLVFWLFFVYFPLAHMLWGVDGLMNVLENVNAKIKAVDFSGAIVVHMSAGWSALALCFFLGRPLQYSPLVAPEGNHSLSLMGTGMLWLGWYGLNAGSDVNTVDKVTHAFVMTALASITSSFVWTSAESIVRGKASITGFCSGVISGLVAISPACGYTNASGAVIIGVAAGLIPFVVAIQLNLAFGYNKAFDIFGMHGVAGTMGVLLTSPFTCPDPNIIGSLGTSLTIQPIEQLKAAGLTIILAVLGTSFIAYTMKAILTSCSIRIQSDRVRGEEKTAG